MNADSPFFPKKYLGQNFLISHHITERIVSACALTTEETILEVGPGKGQLTREIAPRVGKVIAIEKDEQLAARLTNEFKGGNVKIINADFLKFDLGQLPSPIKVIGNLPYNVSTPIITKLLENRSRFTDVFITVQLEFGERMIADINTKDYSSLTCFIQYFTEPRLLFKIRNTAFKPRPKVHSCFVHLKMRPEPLAKAKDEKLLFDVIHQAFQQRRKMIGNALAEGFDKPRLQTVFENLHIDPKSRAENLTITNFVDIANALGQTS